MNAEVVRDTHRIVRIRGNRRILYELKEESI